MLSGLTKLNSQIQSIARDHHLDAYHKFAVGLHSIWQQGGRRTCIGLAISGGVDSMALAFLCQEVTKTDSQLMAPLYKITDYPRTSTSFIAFIVDHKMRNTSGAEVQRVAAELFRLGIRPNILRLNWASYGDPSQLSNVETIARKLRYQAMGRACRYNGIDSLLFAHHADDQHETVLTRIYSNYVGTGLRGMQSVANIPECAGIYGVDHSGANYLDYDSPAHMGIAMESGGVTIGKPLLNVNKQDLVEVCQSNGVKWFEDHTNTDPTLTIRNTFRYLIKAQQLPQALSKERLLGMAGRISHGYHQREDTASRLVDEMPLALDLRIGTANFTITRALRQYANADRTLGAMLLRKMLELVSPKSNIPLQGMEKVIDVVFSPPQSERNAKVVQIAGVDIESNPPRTNQSSDHRTITFRRQMPTKLERADTRAVLWPKARNIATSKWTLWDGRYWIRVQPPIRFGLKELPHVVVKFLSDEDLVALRRRLSASETKDVERLLQVAKGRTRFTLPAIVIERPGNDADRDQVHEVAALPTLGWSVAGWTRFGKSSASTDWLWDIRYKHVNLDLNGVHKVIS